MNMWYENCCLHYRTSVAMQLMMSFVCELVFLVIDLILAIILFILCMKAEDGRVDYALEW